MKNAYFDLANKTGEKNMIWNLICACALFDRKMFVHAVMLYQKNLSVWVVYTVFVFKRFLVFKMFILFINNVHSTLCLFLHDYWNWKKYTGLHILIAAIWQFYVLKRHPNWKLPLWKSLYERGDAFSSAIFPYYRRVFTFPFSAHFIKRVTYLFV